MIFKKLLIFTLLCCALFANDYTLSKNANIGNLQGVKQSLKDCANINERAGLYNQTPLLFAVFNNHIEVARYLVDNGADVNSQSSSGRNVLNYALSNGNFELFKYLKQKGAKVNDELVFDAVIYKKTKFLNEIFNDKDLKLNTNIANYALIYSIIKSDNELFYKTIQKADIKKWFGYKIFDNSKYIDTIEELAKEQNKQEFNFLHLAARYGTKEMIHTLLKKDLYIESLSNIDGKFRLSPVAISAFYKNYDTFVELTNSGANIYKKFKSTNEGNFGLAYMLGAGNSYTTLDFSIVGEPAKVDYRLVDFILKQKDFAKFVPLEDDNFYINFYMLAVADKNGIYEKVLKALDTNGYVKSQTLEAAIIKINKTMSNEKESSLTQTPIEKIYTLVQKCDNPKLLFSQINYFKVDLNKSENDKPILFAAMDKCNSETLIELVKLGANPYAKYDDETIMEFALKQNYIEKDFINYLAVNHPKLNSAFANQQIFNKFLYSQNADMDLYDRFAQNGLKPDNGLNLYFYETKPQQLAFAILDTNKEKLTAAYLTKFIDIEQRYKNNSANINAYAYKNGIILDENNLFLNAIKSQKYSFASDAVLYGADILYKQDDKDACFYAQRDKRIKPFLLEKLCK